MKKYFLGAIVGVLLTLSATTYADDITSLIGKTVQGVFPVKVNGDALAKTAIVIDGTSYLPVRAIGDAVGYDVSFNADLGIELKKKEVTSTMTTQSTTLTPSPTPSATPAPTTSTTYPGYELETINSSIKGFSQLLNGAEIQLKSLQDHGFGDTDLAKKQQAYIDSYKASIADLEQKKAALPPTP
jgi:hypothetical protein